MSKTYTYNELSEEVKAKLRDKRRYSEYYPYNDWHEGVIDMAKEEAEKFGLRIDEIYWSGFSSQGDGASFTGSLRFKQTDEELYEGVHPIYDELLKHHLFAKLQANGPMYTYCSITQSGYYYHENTMYFDWEFDGEEERAADYLCSVEEGLSEALRDYARWIYEMLEKDYDYYMSDEVVDEDIAAQELTYDEDGSEVE